jgi:excisionase family DNA binding protein
MKYRELSVKELAAELGVSTDTIRRAYRNGFIPGYRVGTALRFEARKVHAQMRRNALTHPSTGRQSPPDGRRQPATGGTKSPRAGNTGARLTR